MNKNDVINQLGRELSEQPELRAQINEKIDIAWKNRKGRGLTQDVVSAYCKAANLLDFPIGLRKTPSGLVDDINTIRSIANRFVFLHEIANNAGVDELFVGMRVLRDNYDGILCEAEVRNVLPNGRLTLLIKGRERSVTVNPIGGIKALV